LSQLPGIIQIASVNQLKKYNTATLTRYMTLCVMYVYSYAMVTARPSDTSLTVTMWNLIHHRCLRL